LECAKFFLDLRPASVGSVSDHAMHADMEKDAAKDEESHGTPEFGIERHHAALNAWASRVTALARAFLNAQIDPR
jgi:hypothetical protein